MHEEKVNKKNDRKNDRKIEKKKFEKIKNWKIKTVKLLEQKAQIVSMGCSLDSMFVERFEHIDVKIDWEPM